MWSYSVNLSAARLPDSSYKFSTELSLHIVGLPCLEINTRTTKTKIIETKSVMGIYVNCSTV